MTAPAVPRRRALPLLLLALVPAVILVAIRWNAGSGLESEDPAQYLLHARTIAEGRPYRDTGYLFSPYNPSVGDPAYPVGVPLILAAVIKVAGEHEQLLKAVSLVLALGFFAAAGAYFAIVDRRLVLGATVTMMLGLSPAIATSSLETQTDLPFGLFLWLLLIAADRAERWSWPRVAGITALGLAALAVRTQGLAIIPAMLCVAVIRRRELGWRAVVPPVAWVLISVTTGLTRLPAAVAGSSWRSPDQLIANIGQAIRHYPSAVFDAMLYPFPGNLANDAYHLVAAILMLVGLVDWVRSGGPGRAALWFAMGYTASVVILPYAIARYIWSLYPIIAFGLLNGIRLVVRKLLPAARPEAPDWSAAAAGAVVALGSIAMVVSSPAPGSFASRPETVALFGELRQRNARQPIRVAFIRPRWLALRTGIAASPLWNAAPATVEPELQRLCLTHVVLGTMGMSQPSDSTLRQAMALAPAHFEREYGNEAFELYRYTALRPDSCPPGVRAWLVTPGSPAGAGSRAPGAE